MKQVYKQLLLKLQEYLPDFKIANAVAHFDEASPHMHVVGVPIGSGFKRGLSTKVSKRSVFTPQVLSEVLQDKMRADANYYMKAIFQQEVREKKKGKNHDLTVAEYKVAKEEEKIEKLSTDKIGLEADILVLNHRKSTTQKKLDELDGEIESSNIFLKALRQIKQFIQSYLPFAPLTPEFANHVERGGGYRGRKQLSWAVYRTWGAAQFFQGNHHGRTVLVSPPYAVADLKGRSFPCV